MKKYASWDLTPTLPSASCAPVGSGTLGLDTYRELFTAPGAEFFMEPSEDRHREE